MIELGGVAVGNKLRLVGGITAEVLEIVNDEWAKVRLIEVPDGEPGKHISGVLHNVPPASPRQCGHGVRMR